MLMRSHTALVLALAIECSRGQLATVSQDHTVRIWDLATLQQVGGGLEEGTRGPQATLWPGGRAQAGGGWMERACGALGPLVSVWGPWVQDT